jgi:hypothetical protein
MGHFALHLSIRVRFCPKGYFCLHLTVIIGFCAKKSQKVKGWSFSCDFLKLNAKKALSTTWLFEKCQTTDFISQGLGCFHLGFIFVGFF